MALLALLGGGLFACGERCGDLSGRIDLTPSAGAGDGAKEPPACHTEWPMPNTPSSGLPHPQSYATGSPDTVLDGVTGLLWQKAVDSNAHSWSSASTYCSRLTLDGYGGWRLPSIVELVSIVDVARGDPAIDGAAFPNTPSLPFWSSQRDVENQGLGWYVYFKNGGAYGGNDVSDPQRVRCVRGPVARADGGATCYVVDGRTVHDTRTGLIWERAIASGSYVWDDAHGRCASLDLSGGVWRLPSLKELMTLVDLTRVGPAMDVSVFPDAVSEFVWSSSPGATTPGTAWGVNFNKGSAGASVVAYPHRVRCVR